MNIFLGIAIYVIVWWLSFFVMLPMGAQSHHEADEETVPGTERGPRASITSARRRSMRRGSRPSSGWALPGAFRSTFGICAGRKAALRGGPAQSIQTPERNPPVCMRSRSRAPKIFPNGTRPSSVKRTWRSCRRRAGA
ncbi:MAG: DUF1467 family protein [Caulobacteraceae bacterium]|nr:DUF1467 family protein [Caulobacteraceae bacterium]